MLLHVTVLEVPVPVIVPDVEVPDGYLIKVAVTVVGLAEKVTEEDRFIPEVYVGDTKFLPKPG